MPASPQLNIPVSRSQARLEQTIRTGRRYVQERRQKGVQCPCCDQYAREYRRPLNSGMVGTLVSMWSAWNERVGSGDRNPFFHIEKDLVSKGKAPTGCRDFTLMQWWKLIEAMPPKATGKNRVPRGTGFWKLTDRGIYACTHPRRPLLRKYLCLYNDQPLRFEGPEISILDALGSKFDFEELVFNAKTT